MCHIAFNYPKYTLYFKSFIRSVGTRQFQITRANAQNSRRQSHIPRIVRSAPCSCNPERRKPQLGRSTIDEINY